MIKIIKSLPISVKLMGMTTTLLLFTVGLYGLMNVQELGRAFDQSRTEQQATLLSSATADAAGVTAALAQTGAVLISATAYGDIKALLERMQGMDDRLLYIHVYDGDTIVAQVGDNKAARDGLTPDPEKRHRGDATVEVFESNAGPALLVATTQFAQVGAKGHVEAGWRITDIAERAERIAEQVAERRKVATVNAIFVGGLIVLLGVVLTVLQSLRISRPIRDLTQRVESLANGDLSERAVVESDDEIGVLGRNFNYMAERLGVLLTETKEKATLEKELEVARIIQESLLPPSRLIEKGCLRFKGYFQSASICGGDWWNYAELPDGKLLMLIGDVTGHGVSSAMITAAAKSCCDTLRHVTDGQLTVTFLLEELNKTIFEAANRAFVMTFFATIIDPRRKTITFGNAGHNFPMLFRAQPAEGEPSIVPLVIRGNRLGDVLDSRFLERTVPYSPGDVLVWYTDGITEGVDAAGVEYGEKRFRRSIRRHLDKGPDRLVDLILADAEKHFADFENPEDDITLVVGQFT